MLNFKTLNNIFNLHNNKLIIILTVLINNLWPILKNINLINCNNKEIYYNILINYK